MRTITNTVQVYSFDELSEKAQEAAVGDIQYRLNGPWWDQSDTDGIAETIVYGFAEALKAPGWDTFGEGDFPGVDGIKLVEWDMSRGQNATFKGVLTRDNAPALPWVDSIADVVLNDGDSRWSTYVREVDDYTMTVAELGDMDSAVDDAIESAWRAGRTQMDYLESEGYAREWIDGNAPEFTEDGAYYGSSS